MGVTGLLPQLKEIQENISLEKYRGKTLAIDSYSWLHKSVISCSWELAQDLPTRKYLSYFQKRIQMLRHFGIKPYFVFDGDDFMSKKGTETERSQARLLNKQKGLEYLEKGDRKTANEYFMKSVDVTPSMAKTIIEYLKIERIDYIVAPYEADAQLVYLEKLGLVHGIISEDSDLLIFGAKALLTKLNDGAQCIEILRENFKRCKSVPIGLMNDSQLRVLACLSGCDYTNGVHGIGIVKAIRLVKRLSNMKKCLMSLRLEGKVKIPKDFELEYAKADLSFQYQRVFNPITNEITTLNEIKEQDSSNELLEECIGQLYELEIHQQIAYGDLDPISKKLLLSREDSITSMSQPVFINTPLKTLSSIGSTTATTSKKVVKTPIQAKLQPKVNSIDSFFKTKITSQQPISMRSRSLPTPSLSPTSKRRKLFMNEQKLKMTPTPTQVKVKPITSKFFTTSTSQKAESYELEQEVRTHEDDCGGKGAERKLVLPETVRTIGAQNYKVISTELDAGSCQLECSNRTDKHNGYSSASELTDVDDEIDEIKEANKQKPKTQDDNELKEELGEMSYVYEDSSVVLEHDEGEILEDEKENINTDRVLDGLGIDGTSNLGSPSETKLDRKLQTKEVKRGLFERYGFANNAPVIDSTARKSRVEAASETTAKVKRLTLDSFIYRGG